MPPVSPPAPVPHVDDWHFPSEEAAELAAAPQLKLYQLEAKGNESGTVLLAEGDAPARRLAIGESTASGWQLRSFIVGSAAAAPLPIAVLERDWQRWGALLFVQEQAAGAVGTGQPSPLNRQLGRCSLVATPSRCFVARKGVGLASALRRPRYHLEAADPDYFVKARDLPDDWLKSRMCNSSADGEPTFESAASLLPPSRDYAMVGNVDAITKFSVSPDGRVTSGNHSIFTAMEQGNATGSTVLFDPRNHTRFWPEHNFSEYKSAVVGRVSRAVSVSAWHAPAGKGFAMMAVPNTFRGFRSTRQYDAAEILIRLEDVSAGAAGHEHRGAAKYFGVRDCGPGSAGADLCRGSVALTRTLSPAEFYANTLLHTLRWSQFHENADDTTGPMQLRLSGNEGTRLVDMSRAVISSAMTMFLGQRPNYGDGSVYWSVTAWAREFGGKARCFLPDPGKVFFWCGVHRKPCFLGGGMRSNSAKSSFDGLRNAVFTSPTGDSA